MNKAGYHTLKYRALLNPEEVDEGKPGKVLWPEHLPWECDDVNKLTLKFVREHQGETAFWMQYQNTVVSSGMAKFKPNWIDAAVDKWKGLGGILPLNLKRYIGVDIGGEDNVSDWGVSTVIGTDEEGSIYIIDQNRTHSTINRQIDIMKSLDDKYHASRIGMDAAAQQKLMVSDAMRSNPNIPIFPIKPSRVNDRDTRVDRLSILFETGRIYLNPKLTHLIDELRLYPRAKNDDCIDSLSFAQEASQVAGTIQWDKVPDLITARNNFRISKI